ncbi:MAG: hypothetical protein M1838_006011 [Thelocarpon superellum]|nr:MAG: hypothetical protein M1838_006011 [Thelocarpon superellum]
MNGDAAAPAAADASSSSLIYYPAYCHVVSPTYHAWVKLTAADVHALQTRRGYEGQNLYFYLNHPIRFVRLVGVLVAFDAYDTRWVMELDDSSGATISIICFAPSAKADEATEKEKKEDVPDLRGIDLGSVVKVKGTVGEYRDTRQMVLKRISIVRDTAEEAHCWIELCAFRRDVLSRPWTVSAKMQRRLLKAAASPPVASGKEERKKAMKTRVVGDEPVLEPQEQPVDEARRVAKRPRDRHPQRPTKRPAEREHEQKEQEMGPDEGKEKGEGKRRRSRKSKSKSKSKSKGKGKPDTARYEALGI